jgi:hypothetical protein
MQPQKGYEKVQQLNASSPQAKERSRLQGYKIPGCLMERSIKFERRQMNEIRTLRFDNQNFTFHVVNDITEPCPQCGVPACGKEAYLWVEKDGQKITLVFDGSLFGLIGEEYFTNNSSAFSNYDRLPKFLKDWNENKGWNDFFGDQVHRISVGEFVESLEIIKSTEMSDWLRDDFIKYYSAMTAFANAHVYGPYFYILQT